MWAMQMIDHRSFGPIHFKLVQSFSSMLTPLRYFAQIERSHRPLFRTNAIGKLGKEDREIFNIGWNWLSIASSTLWSKGARHTDHTRNRTNNVMAEVNAVSPHISDLA